MDDTTPTTAEVIAAARIPAALPDDGVVLLGTFTKAQTTTALIRNPDGTIRRIATGDQIGQYVVTAIDTGRLHLNHRDGSTAQLDIPPTG